LGFTSFAAIVCAVAQGHKSVWQHETSKKMGITVSIIIININLLIQSQFNQGCALRKISGIQAPKQFSEGA